MLWMLFDCFRLNTNVDIYQALVRSIQKGDVAAWDDVDSHVAEMFLFDFEQCGIHLPEEKVSFTIIL